MKRKTFLNRLVLAGGGAVLIPSMGLLNSCGKDPVIRTELTTEIIPLLDEIGETIIPTTEASPGAREAGIGAYMLHMVQNCYGLEEQAVFLNGLNALEKRSTDVFNASFVQLSETNKKGLLDQIQNEAIEYKLKGEGESRGLPHYFDLIRGLSISGYFSSEIGMTQARNFLPIPGRYEGCIPYEEGQKSWA